MDQLKQLFLEILNEELMDMVVSNAYQAEVTKIKVRPVRIKGHVVFQVTKYVGTKVFHENYEAAQLADDLTNEVFACFKQIQIQTQSQQISVLMSKKGQVTIKKKNVAASAEDISKQAQNMDHNRKKGYILEEGRAVPFLVDLGVMTEDGKVVKRHYDKFKQINRYLEFIEDILPELDKNRELTMIDFGCGKSYLTFAMYYYLKVLQGYDIRVIGLDLKDDVIRNCTALKERYGYDKLEFLHGDIASFEGVSKVDMVVTLHACDTATDYALYKAVLWGAKVILSVPCCQHELNRQIQSERMVGMLQYGLMKERFAALATDSLRAMLLECVGYKTQILEFIDMSHTPKNILIRAVCKNQPQACVLSEDYVNLKTMIHAKPTLEKLLMTMNQKKITIK